MQSYLVYIFLLGLLNFSTFMSAQQNNLNCKVYFFPGQGSDARVFQNIDPPPEFKCMYISYPVPVKRQSLKQYARQFIPEMDTSGRYILIGYSLGGMICTELAEVLNPEKIIIISSAKTKNELPALYTFQRKVPINKIIPKNVVKAGALILQPLVEPDRKNEKEIFVSMLKAKDPLYLKRTSDMIINWQKESCSESIIHIHGDSDSTIPIINVTYDYLIKDGSHMMVLTRGKEINRLINDILKE